MYAAMTKDERNAVDGRFSATCRFRGYHWIKSLTLENGESLKSFFFFPSSYWL